MVTLLYCLDEQIAVDKQVCFRWAILSYPAFL